MASFEFKQKMAELANKDKEDEARKRERDKLRIEAIRQEYGERKNHPDLLFTMAMHRLICVDRVEQDEALEIALEETGKTMEWYKDIRYLRTFNISSRVVDKFKNTAGYKELVREGNLVTRYLKRSKTTQEHINQIGGARSVVNAKRRLQLENAEIRSYLDSKTEDFVKAVDEAKNSADSTKGTMTEMIKTLTNIDEKFFVNHLDREGRVRMSRSMKGAGLSYKEIADLLNVAERSVIRYCQDS